MKLSSEVLCGVVALALSDSDASEIATIHEHPRLVGAAALLLSSVRILRRERGISLSHLLDQALPFVVQILAQLKGRKTVEAHRAVLHYVALAKSLDHVNDLGFPPGYDGRDSPEQIVVYALALASQPSHSIPSLMKNLIRQKGASDIVVPLVAQLAGLRYGLELPVNDVDQAQRPGPAAEQLALC